MQMRFAKLRGLKMVERVDYYSDDEYRQALRHEEEACQRAIQEEENILQYAREEYEKERRDTTSENIDT